MSERKEEGMDARIAELNELPPEALISTKDCALLHKMSRQGVVSAIDRGKLKAERIGRDWLVRKGDCLAYEPAFSPKDKGKRNRKSSALDVQPGGELPKE